MYPACQVLKKESGKIMRLTIPKSQGKQAFYDARKSSWGDIFPHEPKNPPHEWFRSMHAVTPEDTRIRRGPGNAGQLPSYDALSNDVNEKKRRRRREMTRVENVEEEEIA
jgi:ribosomal protein RSM22 (predicted rRNA methylase)